MELTLQQMFDRTAQHLMAQGCQSMAKDEGSGFQRCLYRGPNGTKCAAGLWIADEHYHPHMEGKTVLSSLVLDALVRSGVSIENKSRLLTWLQRAHDAETAASEMPVIGAELRKDFPTGIRANLRRVANEFGLNTAVLDAQQVPA